MMNRRRLIWQLYPPYLLLVLIALLAAGGYASRAMRSLYMSQIRQELMTQARFLAPRIQPLLNPLNMPDLDRLCKQMVIDVPTRLTIVLPDGFVAADSEKDPVKMENHGDRPEVRQALQGEVGTALRFSGTLGQPMMYLAWPVGKTPVVAVLRVSLALTDIEQPLRALQFRMALGGIVVAVLAALVCMVISQRISRPIEAMRRSAARFAHGELSHRLEVPDALELAGLAHAMNQMAQEMEKRIATIVQQRNESEAVLSSMSEGVVALDPEERIMHMNAAATRLLKGHAEQWQGRSIQEVVRNREVHRMIRKTLSEGVATQGDVALYGQGEQILSAHTAPLFDPEGRRMGVLLVMNDVTQLRRLETIRSDFAANVSHEIKTPLTAIHGFVETLCHGMVTDPQEAQRFLQIIAKHVRRLTAIVDDLMELARIEQGEQGRPLRMTSVPIRQLLQTGVQACRSRADEKSMTIEILCPEELTARMDADLMEQAVINLLDNAIKYSPDTSRVLVSAKAEGEEIRIGFRDEGIGIAQKHLPRLFERFYRVDKNRSRRAGGTGLGLAIVKHIVQAHGGQITVKSVEGRGSTFTIHLPKSG